MLFATPRRGTFDDFDTADASSGDDGPQLGTSSVQAHAPQSIIITIASIEFCSGFLRQAIMQWFLCKQTDVVLGMKDGFVYENWGMLLCCAGIMGGVVAEIIRTGYSSLVVDPWRRFCMVECSWAPSS